MYLCVLLLQSVYKNISIFLKLCFKKIDITKVLYYLVCAVYVAAHSLST